jgi:hypothetical protein
MATLSLDDDDDFNTETTERARDGFVDVPPGIYCMKIAATEDTDTRAGNGKVLNIRWQVDDDANEFNGQCVFQRINYKNPSAEAQRIGRGQLANICDAIGFSGSLNHFDWDDAIGQQVAVTVGWSKAQNGYESKPEVKSVKPWVPGAPAGKPAMAPKPAAQAAKPAPAASAKPAASRTAAAPAGAGTRPWQNRKAG